MSNNYPHLRALADELWDTVGTERERERAVEARKVLADLEGAPSRLSMLDVWLNLGLHGQAFEEWIDELRRTPADAWAQLLAAVRGDISGLCMDTNPPAGTDLIDAARRRLPL
jgi:hypothetical protein